MYDNVKVTQHAHQQYCNRVAPVDRWELVGRCTQQYQDRDYDYKRNWFIHLAGVWWVYNTQGDDLVLITCYGRSDMDMPEALRWAKRHNDRINISVGGEVSCNGEREIC